LLPVLYSFRRCPYAIRARYIIASLELSVSLREVDLKSKPADLMSLGGRSSVPQLIDENGVRHPESLDIVFWALSKSNHKKANELWSTSLMMQNKMQSWITYNDHFFKYWLDRYKYADRYPEYSQAYYRAKGEVFLQRLETRLEARAFLFGDKESVVDIATFPFIRQFAAVDSVWFESSQYHNVKAWLASFVNSVMFNTVVMVKHPVWQAGQEDVFFPA
jgi:glutathione S-transferase